MGAASLGSSSPIPAPPPAPLDNGKVYLLQRIIGWTNWFILKSILSDDVMLHLNEISCRRRLALSAAQVGLEAIGESNVQNTNDICGNLLKKYRDNRCNIENKDNKDNKDNKGNKDNKDDKDDKDDKYNKESKESKDKKDTYNTKDSTKTQQRHQRHQSQQRKALIWIHMPGTTSVGLLVPTLMGDWVRRPSLVFVASAILATPALWTQSSRFVCWFDWLLDDWQGEGR